MPGALLPKRARPVNVVERQVQTIPPMWLPVVFGWQPDAAVPILPFGIRYVISDHLPFISHPLPPPLVRVTRQNIQKRHQKCLPFHPNSSFSAASQALTFDSFGLLLCASFRGILQLFGAYFRIRGVQVVHKNERAEVASQAPFPPKKLKKQKPENPPKVPETSVSASC